MSPWDELSLFDWVMASGSTIEAARWLAIPQSSVSRRFRAFCARHRLDVRRNGSGLHLLSDVAYVQQLRRLAQSFRCRHAVCSCAIPSELLLIHQHSPLLPGWIVRLPRPAGDCLDDFFATQILDVAYVPGHVDALDGLPFLATMEWSEGRELDGLIAFRRRLHAEICALNAKKPPVMPGAEALQVSSVSSLN